MHRLNGTVYTSSHLASPLAIVNLSAFLENDLLTPSILSDSQFCCFLTTGSYVAILSEFSLPYLRYQKVQIRTYLSNTLGYVGCIGNAKTGWAPNIGWPTPEAVWFANHMSPWSYSVIETPISSLQWIHSVQYVFLPTHTLPLLPNCLLCWF